MVLAWILHSLRLTRLCSESADSNSRSAYNGLSDRRLHVALRESFRALEERFPTLCLGIACLGFLVIASVAFWILDYIAGRLDGAILLFLLALAFVGGFSAHEVWLRTSSGRKYYENTWREMDKIIKRKENE